MANRGRQVSITATLVLFGILIALPASADQDLFRVIKNLKVFDAQGKRVGRVISIVDHPFTSSGPLVSAVVAFNLNDTIVALRVMKDHFIGGTDLLFESSDCSGQPLMDIQQFGAGLFPLASVASPGNTIYIPDPNGVPQVRNIQSGLFEVAKLYTLPACQQVEREAAVVSALPTVDLDSRFTPPVHCLWTSRIGGLSLF